MMRRPEAQTTTPPNVFRRKRSDAKLDTVLKAAMEVFSSSGVDAPVREIADRAGVGLGTIYRNFAQRSDLIVAVFQNQVDDCADAAEGMAKQLGPAEAVAKWIERYVEFISTKRGLAAALHSGNAAYRDLPAYFDKRLEPALDRLLETATAAGEMRPGVTARELLRAVATLCRGPHDEEPVYARKMISLLLEGMQQTARMADEGGDPSPHSKQRKAPNKRRRV